MYLNEPPFRNKVKEACAQWNTHVSRFSDIVQWWDRYAKRMIKLLFIREGTERNRDRKQTENFYYTVIYDVLQGNDPQIVKKQTLRKLNAKITRLNSIYSQRFVVDMGDQYRLQGEEPSLLHLIKARKRQASRMITHVLDKNDILQTTSTSIMKVFVSFFRATFQPTQVDYVSIRQLATCGVKCVSPETCAVIQGSIYLEDLRRVINQGKPHKSSGLGGICLEFFKTAWDVIKNDLLQIINLMYIEGKMTTQ